MLLFLVTYHILASSYVDLESRVKFHKQIAISMYMAKIEESWLALHNTALLSIHPWWKGWHPRHHAAPVHIRHTIVTKFKPRSELLDNLGRRLAVLLNILH